MDSMDSMDSKVIPLSSALKAAVSCQFFRWLGTIAKVFEKKEKVKNNNGLPSKRNRLHESLTLICTVYFYTQDMLVNNVMWSQKQQSRRHIVAAMARVIEWKLSCEQGYTFILRRSLVSLVSGMRAFTVNLSEMSYHLTFTICKPVCMSSHLTFWQLERYR